MVKMAVYGASKWSKLISHKIWEAEKSWIFNIVYSQLGCPGLYFRNVSLQSAKWELLKMGTVGNTVSLPFGQEHACSFVRLCVVMSDYLPNSIGQVVVE